MWRPLESLVRKWETARFRHNIEHVLALHKRREVRKDGLKLDRASIRLEIAWRTRDIHPWDRDDPPDKKALYVQQCLEDTDAAITRLFDTLPQVDIIHLKVLERSSEKMAQIVQLRLDVLVGRAHSGVDGGPLHLLGLSFTV
jgi:hypothetical protein